MWRLETSRVELQKDKGIYIIMYTNSGAFLQRVVGGFTCKRWGFHRGFSGRLTRHRNGSGYFTFAQGAKRKVAFLLPCVQQAGERGSPSGFRLEVAPVTWNQRRSGERGKTERSPRGSWWSLYLGQRRTERWPAAGIHGGRLGLPWTAALRWTSGRGKGWRMSSSASQTSWRGLIAPEDDGRDEPATAAHWPVAALGLAGDARAGRGTGRRS
jgi:hypothetical protein